MAPDHQTTPPSTRRAAPLMAEAHEMIERYIEGCGVTLSLSLSLSLSPLLQAPPADCTAIPCIMVFT
jgi:hypothetical protein